METISALERYLAFRNRIEHEDNLIMQRLSWLMASQSFLFTAYAIVTNGLTSQPLGSTNTYVVHLRQLLQIVPVVALINSLLVFIGILAALRAIFQLRGSYKKQAEMLKGLPLQTKPSTRALGFAAPFLLPLLFMAVWLLLLTK
jgi:hypothetical protein